ncbi:MAG: CBS domain-containing protein [bacterium]
METKRVADLMIAIQDYPWVYERQTLKETIEKMSGWQLECDGRKSLPRIVLVFNKHDKLTGVVRRRDILRGLEPSMLEEKPLRERKRIFDFRVAADVPDMSKDKWFKGMLERFQLSYEQLVHGIQERAKRQVSDVMLPANVTVEAETHFLKAVYEMVDNNLSLLPVMKGGKVIGVLRSVEVFHEISHMVLDPPDIPE